MADWTYVSVASETYGSMNGYKNTNLKLAFLRWSGNSTVPTAGVYTFTLPSGCVPKANLLVPLRSGDNMEVRADGTARVSLTANAWSGGAIMYPTT